MKKFEKRRAAIVGSTGMVGRRFAELLVGHPWYEIVMLVGHKSVGETFGEIWNRKESQMQDHYGVEFWTPRPCPAALSDRRVHHFEELLESGNIDLVFSAIPPNMCHLEQQLLDRGYQTFSNTPYGRFEEQNPLVVAEVNGEEIGAQRFIKNPNCVSSGLALILAPIKARYGVKEISVVTFQSLSGKGDAKYPRDLVVGNIYSLHETEERTEEYIRAEIRKIFREETPISVSCNRVYVQEGHFVDVKINTVDHVKSESEIKRLFQSFNPLGAFGLPSCLGAPLVVLDEISRPRPRQDAFHLGGMAVAVGGISTKDDLFDIRLQFVVNNLIRGAAGGAIANSDLSLRKIKLEAGFSHR